MNEAKGMGIAVSELKPGTVIEQAEWLLRHAQEDWENGVRGDAVKRILAMTGNHMDLTARGAQETTGELAQPDPTPHRAQTDALVRKHRLPVPPEIEGEAPEMPRDLTSVDDRSVRKLHAEFNAWLNRVLYLIGVERADQQSAELLLDRAKRRALVTIEKLDANTGKAKLASVLASEVESDPEVLKWEERVAQHKANLHVLYSLKDVYAGNVERLSRDWRMRRDEFDMGAGSRG